jgi:hypothetical protein
MKDSELNHNTYSWNLISFYFLADPILIYYHRSQIFEAK